MYRLYQRNEVHFAILWITIYCVVTIPIRGEFGDVSLFMLLALVSIALALTYFIKKYKLETKYGLDHWPQDTGKFLYFIPVWILTTGNLWGGIELSYAGFSQVWAILSMLLIGYIEEIIFRGFLFKGMIPRDGLKHAILITSVTFGIGHIVNLLAGQASLETVAQVFFAIAWGFILTTLFYKSGSLLPCILVHGLIDAFSKFSQENLFTEWLYIIATILLAASYCPYLLKKD
ncbi:CPBP family intramembrane glutamic endopeptidase [Hutsoniella sourekii]